VVHLHLFNRAGDLYLQKRSAFKDILPGKWDTSVGGHVSPGESIEAALIREVSEEISLQKFSFLLNKKYVWQSARERELVWSFTGESDEKPVANPEEIETGRFWHLWEIKKNLGKEIFTPNFEYEFNMFFIT
jgi:isopentenyldiphosphate isomerase